MFLWQLLVEIVIKLKSLQPSALYSYVRLFSATANTEQWSSTSSSKM